MSKLWAPPPPPATALGIHRKLAPVAGVRVSPICLGAGSIGDKWSDLGMGAMDKASSFKLLDAFYNGGGNFIDTANSYQDESSEEFLGEWMEARGIRDQMIIATKYSNNYKRGATDIQQKTQYIGNNMKSLHISVEASLKKLRTDYIDILYVHWVSSRCAVPIETWLTMTFTVGLGLHGRRGDEWLAQPRCCRQGSLPCK